MKVPALVFGIIGTVLDALIFLPSALISLLFSGGDMMPTIYDPQYINPYYTLIIIGTITTLISIVIGIIGSALALPFRKPSGILLIIASVFSVISIILISTSDNGFYDILIIIPLIFLIGGITALLPEKRIHQNNPSGNSDL